MSATACLCPKVANDGASYGVAGCGDGNHGDMGAVAGAYRMAGVVRRGPSGSDASRPAQSK